MKAYFKLLMLILISTLYYGCSQDPYDWTGGKTTVAIKEISSPIVRSDMIQVQTKLDIGGAKIDKITFVLYKNKEGNWEYEDEKAPSLVEGTSDTYFFEFSGLTANTQYKVIIRIWINNSEEPIIEQEQYVTTASAIFTLQTVDAVVRNQHVVELYGNFQSEEIKATQDMLGFIVSETDVNLEAGDLRPCLEISSDGSFSTVADGLKPGTNYYYAACFVHEGKQYFGETKSFCTQDIELTEGEYIDLGMDVLWASCNLGSDTPEGSGKYYGWGNPSGNSNIKKTFKTISGTGYDAAFYSLGNGYRIPTKDEWSKLLQECTWEWTSYKGVNGYKVTGTNGNSIFLPTIGYDWSTNGYYYVGTQDSYVYNYTAQRITLSESKHIFENNMSQAIFSIRPVKDERVYCETSREVSNITTNSAYVTGLIKASIEITERGIWYGEAEYPHPEEGMMQKMEGGEETIAVTLSGLSSQTVYYYATYAKVGELTYFGQVEKFTTEKGSEISTEQIVDLGLSVNWAGYNIGANSPDEYGEYYAWGEVTNKENYTEESYLYYDKEYINIGQEISTTQYDVARFKWGESWRMPTQQEFQELIEKCTWESMTYNGIEGRKITGPNGKSIFIPLAGFRKDTNFSSVQYDGYYWSGTYYPEAETHAALLEIHGSFNSPGRIFYSYRVNGYPVRAVSEK